jgi:archaellum component FlaG (FlaF/FlaG flagellin family)
MRGISAIVVIVLILMITISLAGLGYVTFTTFFSQMTTSTSSAISSTLTTMLAQMKIESITKNGANNIVVYIRNTGKVDLTNFTAYVNESIATTAPGMPTGNKISPGGVDNVTITSFSYAQGNTVKVTTAQGAVAIQTEP